MESNGAIYHQALSASQVQAHYAAVVPEAPANFTSPTISGTPNDGLELNGGNGSWEGYPLPSFSYQWQRCNAQGAECSDIAEATGSAYRLTGSDVGSTIRLLVTGVNSSGSAHAASAPTTVVASLAHYKAAVLDDDPVGYWPMNDPVGTTTVGDASGNGYNGMPKGGVTAGESGPFPGAGAFKFDGAACTGVSLDAYASEFAWSDPLLTVEVWVNTTRVPQNGSPTVVLRDRFYGWGLSINSSGEAALGASPETVTGNTSIIDGKWHLIDGTLGGGEMSLYVDGHVEAQTHWPSPQTLAPGAELAWGRDGDACDGVNPSLFGMESNAAIYHTSLTPGRVLAHYQASGLPPAVEPPPSDSFGTGSGGASNVKHPKCGDPVDCATGNFTEAGTDLTVDGRGGPMTFARTYNAMAAAAAGATVDPLGYGWSASYFDTLSADATTGEVTVTPSDGSTAEFYPNGDGTYTAPAWIRATLAQNVDGSYTFTLPDQSSETFSSSGGLTSETDSHGNTTSLTYASGQLSTITGPSGRSITLTWNPNGQIASAADPDGTVHYSYDSSGNLTKVFDIGGGEMGLRL